ncbi:DUF1120 domain-containing protein [Herbaspirillum sp. alder98]|uniref:DUF1120 domain-containing protein n=1 Tax=Herbaspirillum sp. alder98 TaxID=2913096 RepID=UPI001CD841EC|nr:DUF1120 domain-containing protein [Herbaspirillum sp. alder98]MCA1323944.1 DUF1120 domain-containing protein [Herbaspirillum sp. alder98]
MKTPCPPTRTDRASGALPAPRRGQPSRRQLMCALLFPTVFLPAAMAADTAQLRVIGRVVPAPCTITLGNNGSADFGTITAADLPGDGMRKLSGERSLSFAIQCVPANSPRLSFKDDRTNSVPAIWNTLSTAASRATMFGLGRVDDKNIGMYNILFRTLKADGQDARLLRAPDTESAWQFIDQGEFITKEYKYAWSTTAQPQTGSFGALNGDLVVKLWPEPLDQLPLQSEIRLDGSATLVLEYP